MSDSDEPVIDLVPPKVRKPESNQILRESIYNVVKACLVNGKIPRDKSKLIQKYVRAIFSTIPHYVDLYINLKLLKDKIISLNLKLAPDGGCTVLAVCRTVPCTSNVYCKYF